ncbi:unnamed protein product, partial [Bubo scandiacus]
MEFPQHSKQVLEQLNQQRQLGLLCDCTFVVDGINFKAHKAVLAACSEYFRMLFVDQKDVVHLDISNAAGLGQVLEFMYTAKLSLNPDNVEDVLAVAGFLQMQEIVSACNALKSLSVPAESPAENEQPPAEIGTDKATVEDKTLVAEALGDLDKIKPVPPDLEGKEETPTAAAAAQPEAQAEQLGGQKDAAIREGPNAEFTGHPQPVESAVGSPAAKGNVSQGTETGEMKLEGKEEEGEMTAEEEEEAKIPEEEQPRLENGENAEDNESGSTDSGQENSGETRLLRSGTYSDRTETKAYGSVTHKCEDCGKEFTHTGNFKRHIRIHTGEKPFSCRECNKAFSDPAACKAHEKTHSPLKPYGCEECGKSYRLISLLNLHKKRHTGEAKYRCDDCGKLFTTSGNLKRHQLVHSGEKPYQCDYCGRSFSDPTSKMRHLETHDTDKEHKCPHCDKKFNQVGNLKAHLKIHIADGPLKCRECGKQFTTSGSCSPANWPTTSATTIISDPTNAASATKPSSTWGISPSTSLSTLVAPFKSLTTPQIFNHPQLPDLVPRGEAVPVRQVRAAASTGWDNLRSHVKTVHQGKAGIKILEPEEGDEVNIVTVASDDMVTLATEALAATAVTQLTVVPVAAAVTADETEALKAEITKAVKQVQEADPNTQILYACDSCGEKFLDASSLAQHVRIHTAQALVMFQADTDFYQQYGPRLAGRAGPPRRGAALPPPRHPPRAPRRPPGPRAQRRGGSVPPSV